MLNDEIVNKDEEIINFVNELITNAIKENASDIHIEPKEKFTQVRFRKDGKLYFPEGYDKIPKELHNYIVARIKVLTTTMKLDVRLRPQDGKFRLKIEGNEVDFRVGTIPTIMGEAVVLRILRNDPFNLDIDNIFNKDKKLIDTFKRNLENEDGVILFTGLSGSGKSTIALAAVNELSKKELKIITIEDPVEVYLEKVNQVQVNHQQNVTFEAAARQAYRQDVDVLYMGEIRTYEVAHLALEGGLTGFLVLSTIHTNSAMEALFRCTQMGIKKYLTASTVKFIVNSKLADKMCQHCKEEHKYSKTELLALGLTEKEIKENKFYKGKGCEKCNQKGYSGRVAIIEMLEINSSIKDTFIKGSEQNEVTKIAKKEGVYYTLQDDALKKFKDGTIDLETARRFAL